MNSFEEYYARVEWELVRAKQAIQDGNDGMARVCSRRAVGAIVEAWMTVEYDPLYGTHTMSALRGLTQDEHMPPEIQEAANRLQHGIRAQHTENFPHSPIEDAILIVHFIKRRIEKYGV